MRFVWLCMNSDGLCSSFLGRCDSIIMATILCAMPYFRWRWGLLPNYLVLSLVQSQGNVPKNQPQYLPPMAWRVGIYSWIFSEFTRLGSTRGDLRCNWRRKTNTLIDSLSIMQKIPCPKSKLSLWALPRAYPTPAMNTNKKSRQLVLMN